MNATVSRNRSSNETFDHASHLSEWENNSYHQLLKNFQFFGSIDHCYITEQVNITLETIDSSFIEQIAKTPSDKVIALNIQSDNPLLLNGRMVSQDIWHFSSGLVLHAVCKKPVQALIISIDKKLFWEWSREITDTSFIRPSFEIWFSIENYRQEHFWQTLSWAKSRYKASLYGDSQDLCHTNYQIKKMVQEILLTGLSRRRNNIQPHPQAYIVSKSCEYFFSNIERIDLGIMELCDNLKICRRTLQYSFEFIVGISPLQYTRIVRLNKARKILINSQGGKIQDAALDAGFSHLGRFSKYYHDFFGELPSETLKSHE